MRKILLLISFFGIQFISDLKAQEIDTTAITPENIAERKRLVSIGPGLLEFKLSRGQSKSEFIYIVNRKDKPYSFNIELLDFTFDIDNSIKFIPNRSSPHSAADIVSVDKTLIEVPANSTGKVLVTVNIPDNEDADKLMKWILVGVNTVTEAINATDSAKNLKIGLTPTPGVAVQVFQMPPGARKDVKMVSFERINDSTCRMVCENTGDTRVLASASVELTSTESDFKEIIRKDGMNILPGTRRNVDLIIPKTVPKGKYTVVAIYDAGDDDVPLEATQTTLEIQ